MDLSKFPHRKARLLHKEGQLIGEVTFGGQRTKLYGYKNEFFEVFYDKTYGFVSKVERAHSDRLPLYIDGTDYDLISSLWKK